MTSGQCTENTEMLGLGLSLTSVAVLGRREVSAAALMLANEPQGLAIDFTDAYFLNSTGHYGSARVKDAGTPGNNYDSHPFGLLTYSGASPKLCRGPDGNLRYGAHNLHLHSNNYSNLIYNLAGQGVVSPGISDPYGGNNAWSIVWDSGDTISNGLNTPSGTSSGLNAGFQYIIKLRLRDNGTNNFPWTEITTTNPLTRTWVNIATGAVGTAGHGSVTSTPLGNGWYEYSLVTAVLTSASELLIRPRLADNSSFAVTGDGVSGLHITRHQVSRYPADSTYLATTSAARYELPYEWDTDGTPLGIRVEEQRTNLALWSNDFTNAVWVKTNITAAKTAMGPDGVANSASTLTATAANATALQAITSASAQRITSCYIKRRTGSGNIELTQDNGSTWTPVTVTSEWTRVNLPAVTSANPTVGIRIVTSGDAVDVALFQHEVGDNVSSPIETAGSTVTRAADVFGVPLDKFPWNNGNGILTVNDQAVVPETNGTMLILRPPGNDTHIRTVKWVPSP